MDGKLVEAARMGNIELLHKLVEDDPLVLHSVALQGGETPLHIACKAGHLNIVQEILRLKEGFSRDVNQDGFSPLHFASANGYLDIVKELLRVDPNLCLVRGREGKIPLHSAAIKGRVEVIKELLAAKPDSVEELTAWKETALHLAVKYYQFEALRFMAEHLKVIQQESTILNREDQQGNTIFHLAVSMKQYEVVEFLVGENSDTKAKVEVNCFNKSGLTALDVLLVFQSEAGDREIVEILRQAGAFRARDLQTSAPNSFIQKQEATVEAESSFTQNQEVTTEAEVSFSENYQEATVEAEASFLQNQEATVEAEGPIPQNQEATIEAEASVPQNQEATIEAEVSLSQNQGAMVEAEASITSLAQNQETTVEAEAAADAEASLTQNLQDVATEVQNEDAISEESSTQSQEATVVTSSSSYKQSEAAQEHAPSLREHLIAIGSIIWYSDVHVLPSEIRDFLLWIALSYIMDQSTHWPLNDVLVGSYVQHDAGGIVQHLKHFHFYGAFLFVSTVKFFFLSLISDILILKYRFLLNGELIISFTDFILTYGTFTVVIMPKDFTNQGLSRALWAVPVLHILVFKLKDRTNKMSQGHAPKGASQENIQEVDSADGNSSAPSSSQNKDDKIEASLPQNLDATEMVSSSKNEQSDSETVQGHDLSLMRQLVRYFCWCENIMYHTKEIVAYFVIPYFIRQSTAPYFLSHCIEAGAMSWGLHCGMFVFDSAFYFFHLSFGLDVLLDMCGFSLNEELIISTTERILTYGTSMVAIMPQGIINNNVFSPALFIVTGMHLLALKAKRSRMRLSSAPKGASWESFEVLDSATEHNGDEQSKVVQRHDLSLKQLLKQCFSWYDIIRNFPSQVINTCLVIAFFSALLVYSCMTDARGSLQPSYGQIRRGMESSWRSEVILVCFTIIYMPILNHVLHRLSFQKGLICICISVGCSLVPISIDHQMTFSIIDISIFHSIAFGIISGLLMAYGKELQARRIGTRQCTARESASLDSVVVDSADRSSGVPAP